MCWYCCISLRGAVYFGTSVHIFVGLILFLRWIVMTYIDGFVTNKLLIDASVLIGTVLSGMYIVFFITLGCLVFAGTERKSVSVLKWSAAGFSILQILVFIVILILYLVAPGGLTILEPNLSYEMNALYISTFFFCLIATTNYLIVLFLYIRKLWNIKKRSPSMNNNIRISGPIIASQTTTHNPRIPSTYAVSYHRDHGHQGQHRRPQGPESPGIYESLDTHSLSSHNPHINQQHQLIEQQQHPHPFYPANFYSSYNARHPEGLYSGGGGGSLSGSQRGGGSVTGSNYQRAYPFPHQRHREPLTEEEEDWAAAYGGQQRVHIFQRGQPQRNSAVSSSSTTHPLLQAPHNY